MSEPTDLEPLLRGALAHLRRGDRPPGAEDAIVRVLAGWEREHRVAVRSLARETAPDRPPGDPATTDEEETSAALRRRVAELSGLREGFVKALALTLGHEAAARLEAEARRRAGS